ncbi:DUF5666 domain-containing protein [Pelomonas baiyunensis]|uniref:DUF5666 domain-containing protein n=1 Tax=Pelomonas baiyunensis TaxID=3299026 RepID=A0ABW7GXI7_9BURK
MTRPPQFPSPRRPLPDDTAHPSGLNRSLSRRLNRRLSRRDLLALAGAAGLAGCGGGSTDPAPAAAPAAADTPLTHPLGVATGGTGRVQSFLSAAITATAPVTVGGVSLGTSQATLCDGDGHALRVQDLSEGMTARVLAGTIVASTAQAYSLVVDTQAVGPATWLDSRTLTVLGQRVNVPTSALRGPGASGTPATVQVWGHLDLGRGSIVATRLERATPNDTPMLRGVLTARGTDWLQVGALTARAADATVIPANLTPGAVVRLVLGPAGADGTPALLQARDDALRPPDGLEAELEGRITEFTSPTRFTLDGVPVDASGARVQGLAWLQPGGEAEVHGRMRNGVLVATEVSAEAPEPVEISGRMAALDVVQRSFTLRGWTVTWTASTRFTNGTAADLRAGRKLTVKGQVAAGAAQLLASAIVLE